MEIILVLLGGYLLSKLFNGSSSKPKRRRRKSGFWGQAIQSMMLGGNHTATKTSYSDCRTKKKRASRPLAPALKLSIVVNAHLFSNLQTSKGIA